MQRYKNEENSKKEREQQQKAKDSRDVPTLKCTKSKSLASPFQSQLDKIEKTKYKQWLVGAGFFLVLSIGIGVWFVLSGRDDISGVIGRLALTPFTVAGIIFCAKQYVRSKNLIDDYSYREVLAKLADNLMQSESDNPCNKEILTRILTPRCTKTDKNVDDTTGINLIINTSKNTARKIIKLNKKVSS